MKLELYLPLGHKEACQRAIDGCIDAFGGCTVVKGDGFWKDESGKLFAEPVKVVSVFTEGNGSDHWNLVEVAKQFRKEAKQQCVLIVVDGKHEFV